MASVSGSVVAYPQAYDKSDYSFSSIGTPTNPVGKGSSNGSYAEIGLNSAGSATSYIFWPFDLSSIPANATIDSVTCKVKARVNATSYLSAAQARLYSGSTAKGSNKTILTQSASATSVSAGTWTREELSACRLRLYAKMQDVGASGRSIWFYGADLTVTYTYQSEKFMLKLGGSWTDVARVFKKVNGIWVEQTELANVIEDGVRYKNGGEIESAAPPVTLISFTLGSVTYQAAEGMTWADYVASSYNTAGFSISGSYVLAPDGRNFGYTSAALATDKIIDGQTYYF